MTTALLIAHADPPIHGQAVAAATLLQEAAGWQDVRLLHVNAVYATQREKLTGFSLGKVRLLARYIGQALRLIRKERVEVVILTPAFFRGPFLKDALLIWTLRALTRVKIVGWVHMDPRRFGWDHAPGWLRWIADKTLNTVDRWVACGSSLARSWPDEIPTAKRYAIPNGIDAPTAPERDGQTRTLRVGYLSALDPEKGWRDLFEVAEQMVEQHPELEFHFYGNASGKNTEEEVRAAFANTPHASRIQWHGPAWGEDKWKAFREMDLFCFPSHTEQFPIAVLDAMSMGLPVIASNVGAVFDAIDGQGGWLIEPKQSTGLRKALEQAIAQREQLPEMGHHNRNRFEAEFSRPPFGQRWHEFLKEIA